jgi:hypothetical protein
MIIQLQTSFPIAEVYYAGYKNPPGHRAPNAASLGCGICDISPKTSTTDRFLGHPFLLVSLTVETIVALPKTAPDVLRGLVFLRW